MVEVSYECGQARMGNYGVDFMMATVEREDEDIYLYAEVDVLESDMDGCLESDEASERHYAECKSEIIRQALEAGVDVSELKFWWED